MPESRSEDVEAPLSPGEWATVSEQRALVYGWLSTLYAAEIPQARLAAYLAGEAAPLLEGFATMGLGAEAGRLQAAIDALREVRDAHLELAADFAQLFLLDASAGALPYASAHDAGQGHLFGPAEARMRAFLARASLAIRDDFKEPADHLAVHLALMARIA
ncbi:MAG: molecular chaperone TorD, partial [Geminicoccaceae bacterium]|nr:molecular chaperone TorD [Geminicoccaceae bacterium]